MRVGVVLVGGDWPAIAQAAKIVDNSMIDCIGFWDHFQPLGFNTAAVNGWAAYGHLTAITKRVRLCPLVLDGPNYSIGRLAKETSMLGVLSGGRFELGIGIGDAPQEEAAWGLPPYPDAATRITWLEETIAALRLVWLGQAVDFAGTQVRLEGAACRPAPPAPLRVVIGAGGSRRMVRSAVRYADEINVYGDPELVRYAQREISASGRTVQVSTCTHEEEDWGAQPEKAGAELGAWSARGVDRLFLNVYPPYTFLPAWCELAARMGLS